MHVASVLLLCDGKALSYSTSVSEISMTSLSAALGSLAVAGTGGALTYGAWLVGVGAEVAGAVAAPNTVTMYIDAPIHESQWADVEYMLRLAFTEMSPGD